MGFPKKLWRIDLLFVSNVDFQYNDIVKFSLTVILKHMIWFWKGYWKNP